MKNFKSLLIASAIVSLLFGCSHLSNQSYSQNTKSEQNLKQKNAGNGTIDSIGRFDQSSSPQAVANGTDSPLNSPGSDTDAQDENDAALSDRADRASSGLTADEEQKEGQSKLDDALDFCELAQSYWQKGELESALETLDKGYAMILEVDPGEDPKLIQQKEDLRFLISKRILEIYASRNIVVNGQHNEIPLEMNRHIEAELKRFSNGENCFFKQSYQRSGKFRPYIVEALKKAGLPEELSWLPLIESGFKVKALSKARALGLWQFIPSTGYKFGLKRTQYIDERIDFMKATDSAIAYLKELHSIFGDWSTVLAAYNCGEGRVLQVIRTQNINYLDNFWDLYERLPMETARYVPRFFATLHMVKNPEKYGLDTIELDQPFEYETVDVNRQVHLKTLSSSTGITLDDLKELNPELRYQLLPPETYSLRVPVGTSETLLAKIDDMPTSSLPQRGFIWHRVRSGETLSIIARHYRTSVRRIMSANNMRNSFIRAGKSIKIPRRGYTTTTQAAVQRTAIPASGIHRVRKGDSLWIIAKKYGTTVKAISSLNSLSSSDLYIGQALKIPGYKSSPLPDTSQLGTYKVKSGDSPFTIAQKHNMQLEQLLRINRLNSESKIYPGQTLYIE